MRKNVHYDLASLFSKGRYLKKTAGILLIAGMICSFTACGAGDSDNKLPEPVTKTVQEITETQKPDGSIESAKPEDGSKTAKPDGSSTDKPDSGIETARPDAGSETAKPDGGNKTAKPGNTSSGAKDLMEGIKGSDISVLKDLSQGNRAYTGFAVKLFKECNTDKDNNSNMLVSPLSVIYALGMTSGGSAGNTAAQFEKLYGLKQKELDKYMYSYLKSLSNTEDSRMSIANSIWLNSLINDRRPLNSYLHNAADYYDAKMYSINFDRENIHYLNDWVKEKTEGMIEKIIDDPDPSALMVLVNAVAFDAKWKVPYEEYQIRDAEFTFEDGTKKKTGFLYSDETAYLQYGSAQGFMKYYKGGKYAFAALLPAEGVKLDDFIATLDGEKLYGMLQSPERETVNCAIPKFETAYETKLQGFLANMGISDAFNPGRADFSKMYEGGGVCIDEVIHKTYIKLDENGTKAAAVTGITMKATAVMKTKSVILNRPFVYMLVDCENGIPFFIGRCDKIE